MWRLTALFATLVLLASCGLLGREASYRYRLTIEAETSRGGMQGSGVLEEVATLTPIRVGDSTGKGGATRGEAIVIDLPSGPVFALLELPNAGGPLGSAVTMALAPDAAGSERSDYIDAVRRLGGWFSSATAELPRAQWPLMVRFRDLNDPTSVTQVEPEALGISHVRLETTGEEVSTGIRSKLPWLIDGGLTLDPQGGPTSNPTFAQTLRQRVFTTEIRR